VTNKNPSAPPPSLLEYFNAAQGAYAVADAAVFEGGGPAPSGLHVVENSVHFIFGERCSCHPICASRHDALATRLAITEACEGLVAGPHERSTECGRVKSEGAAGLGRSSEIVTG
jgi:hypothetical protein